MQIHELNDFTGELGSGAFIVVDDGEDTGKVSTAELLSETNQSIDDLDDSLNARIDNIIAPQGEPSLAELVDVRLGADGVTYATAGEAVRAQFTDVKADISEVNDASSKEIGLKAYYEWSSGYIATNGDTVDVNTISPNSQYYCMVIPCQAGDVFHVKTTNASSTARPWCFVSSTGTNISVATSNAVDTYLTAPTNAAYLVCNSRYDPAVVYGGTMIIKKIIDQFPQLLNMSDANADANGNEIPASANLNSYTTAGTYFVRNNTSAASISNIPKPVRPGLLFVFQIYYARYQLYINDFGVMYGRYVYMPDSTWHDWDIMNNSILDEQVDYAINKENTVEPTLTANRIINYQTGELDSNSNYHGTAYLTIPEGTTAIRTNFYNSVSGNDGFAFYTENDVYVSGGKNSASNGAINCPLTITTIPSTAKKIAFCGRISLEENDVPRTVTFINGTIAKTTGKNYNYKVVMLGDSIIGNFNADDSIPSYLEQISGAKCYNCGFGGSTMGSDTNPPVHTVLEAFNGWRIINAIATSDYTDQLQAIEDDPDLDYLQDYFASHIATLQAIDWNDVDIITMSYGTNDWGVKVTLDDNPNNLKDTDTFGGAFRTALETLWSVYPHIKVMLCGCIWRGLAISGTTITSSTDDGAQGRLAPLKDYEAKIKSVAEEYHVLFVPMYDYTGFNPHTWTQYFSATDATHPARKGRYVMAKRYASFLGQM